MLLEKQVRPVLPVCQDEMDIPVELGTPVPPERAVTECLERTELRESPVYPVTMETQETLVETAPPECPVERVTLVTVECLAGT